MTFWAWAGRHGTAVKFGSILAAVLLLAGGLVLGMSQASGNPAPVEELGTTPPASLAKQTDHYIVGTIALVLPARREAIVRRRNGQLVQVSFDTSTVVRRDRASQAQTALRRGTRVIVLGEPMNGRLHAQVVTITGQAPVRPAAPARPVGGGGADATKPTAVP
ncbi:MAG TPA: hypothetical protein VFD32_21030 [Dehalococcoidia bacterium]|nr:hypothetical protein [Dehalococcoidia bacterium]